MHIAINTKRALSDTPKKNDTLETGHMKNTLPKIGNFEAHKKWDHTKMVNFVKIGQRIFSKG